MNPIITAWLEYRATGEMTWLVELIAQAQSTIVTGEDCYARLRD